MFINLIISIAIRFNIPCVVTVTLNPRPSGSGSGRIGFMNLYKNNYNNHLLLTNAGEVGTLTQTFAKDEILCIDCSGYTTQYYYKLAIQPYTVDGKIPLSTNVDEYINYENLWFKNGSGSEVIANPTLTGAETALTGLQVDGTKYAVPQGGGKLYMHHIYGNQNESFTVYTTDSTPFTTLTITNFLKKCSPLNITGSYYPMNDKKNTDLFEKYQKLAEKEDNIIFGGRLGMYQYFDMWQVIDEALKLVKKLK